jgi:hypothetical protein
VIADCAGPGMAPPAQLAAARRADPPTLCVPETQLMSCDLPIFMGKAADSVMAADAGEVGLAVFRERA